MTTNEFSQALQPNMFHKPAGAVNRVLWTMVMALTRQLLLWRGRCCALTIFSAFHAQLAGASQGHVVQKTGWKLRWKRKNSKHDFKTLNEWFKVFLPIKIWESYLNQEFTTEQFSLDASEIVTVVCEVYWASTTLDQRCWCSSSAAGSIAERWCAFQTVECGFSPTALHRSDPWLHLCTFFVSMLGTHLYSLKLKQQDLQYSRQSRTWTCNLAKI